MNATDLNVFNQAISMAQAGQKQVAYQQLKNLLPGNSHEATLLLWIAFTAPDLREAEAFIGAAVAVAPGDPNLASAQQWLAGEKARQAPPAPMAQLPVERPLEQPMYRPAINPSMAQLPVERPLEQSMYRPAISAPQEVYQAAPIPYHLSGKRKSRLSPIWFILPIVIMFVAVVTWAALQFSGSTADGFNILPSSTAPDFTLKDLQGRDVKLSAFRGKAVLIKFWATW
jgi:hypothetical protein